MIERNFAKEPLTRKELTTIIAATGAVAPLVNTRHARAKEHNWKTRAPSKIAFIRAALDEPNVMRRPVLVSHGEALIGKAAIEEALAR